MKTKVSLLTIISVLMLSFMIIPINKASAQIPDGTHSVPYEMKEANNNNTSIANGYFQSPAKVTVSGDTATVQITVTSADMVKGLGVSGGSMSVVSESGDTRTYSFQTSVSNLSNPISMNMHIVVPDLPELPGGYDRDHTARAVFDVSGIAPASSDSEGGESATDTKEVENPKTGDKSPIVLYTILLVGAAGAFVLVRKLRPANE